MSCTRCGARDAGMYLPDGEVACKSCFYADDTHRKEDSSSRQAITGGYVAIVLGVLGIAFCVLIGLKKGAVVPALIMSGGIAGIRLGKATQRRLLLRA